MAGVGTSSKMRMAPSGVFMARVRYMPGCMYVGIARPPLFNWIISKARSMAPQ